MLAQILTNLENAKRTSTFDVLRAAVEAGITRKGRASFREISDKVRDRLRAEPKSSSRIVFKACPSFEGQYTTFSRIDLIVQSLIPRLPDDAKMENGLTVTHAAQDDWNLYNAIIAEPFCCPAFVQLRQWGLTPDMHQAARNLLDKGVPEKQIVADYTKDILTTWWTARFDSLALAIAEIVNALADGTVKAIAVGPDGATHDIPTRLWLSADGWTVIVEGYVEVARQHLQTPGATHVAKAGIYISPTNPIPLIRSGKTTPHDKASAVQWLLDQVKASPTKPRRREDVQVELTQAPWKFGPHTFKGVWTEAMRRAKIEVPGHSWSQPGPRKI